MMLGFVLLSIAAVAQSVVLHESARTWPQNSNANGGAIVEMSYPGLGNGSCLVQLPDEVNLFHVTNGFIVPESTDTFRNLYKISAPTHWSLVNGTFNTLIIFKRNAIFDLEDIAMECDPTDVSEINVYSFPQNNLIETASSTVCFRPAFHAGDVLTITLPVPVKSFNFTTWDSAFSMTSEDNMVYTLTGFKAPFGQDYNTEVSFILEYEGDEGSWFSAGDIDVIVDRAPTPTAPAS